MNEKIIGFIGLGVMGHGMARNVLEAGFPLVVCDVNPAPVQELVGLGASSAPSPAALAEQVDVVLTALPGTAQVESVVFGVGGLLAGLRPGSTMVDFSTVSPNTTRRVAHAIEAKGARHLDAGMTTSLQPPRRPLPDLPVIRVVAQAMSGTMRLFLGGDPQVIAEVQDVLDAVSQEQFYCGPHGAGVTVKLANNMVTVSTVALLSELFVWAEKNGVGAQTMLEALSQGSANSNTLQGDFAKRALRGDFPEGLFPIDYMHKDATEALEAARGVQMPMLYITLVQQVLEMSRAAGDGGLLFTSLLKTFERLGGAQARIEE
jgi:3-hydroxyisobutyrate dehydrogenase-like beta-hydroxyacid dehydrogenase